VADNPVRWGILGTGGIEVDGDFRAPATAPLGPRKGDPVGVSSVREGRGIRHEAGEIARRLAACGVESPLTTGTVLAQARRNA
jgi:hypothetical protein